VTVTGKVLLVHGGLREDTGADWFWRRTGVIDGLERRGLAVLAPDRHPRAAADALLRLLPSAADLPASPEAARPEFPGYRDAFCDAVAAFAADG
jgi:hypothetical protein